MNLAEIKLSPEVQRRIRTRYREQMKKWAPKFVQSRAPPAAKGLMVMMTDIWEGKGKPSKSKRGPRRRSPRWRIESLEVNSDNG